MYDGEGMTNLGQLYKVELRNAWETEDRHFTPWLAEEKNLNILADTVGLELELEAVEKNVGPFRADILCKDTQNDSWVLIENQLEKTDHRHLGQLMTYAAGLQAVTIVWVADKFSEEHRAAMDWLNKITGEDFKFFGLEIELWKIDDSNPAPKFNIISKPNNWSRSVSQASNKIESEIETPLKKRQFAYWQGLEAYLNDKNSFLKPPSPRPQHWAVYSIGKTGFSIYTTIHSGENRLGVELMMYDERAKAYFSMLEDRKKFIESQINHKLDWRLLPDKKGSRIVIFHEGNFDNESFWVQDFKWFHEMLESFDKTFRSLIKNLEINDIDMEAAE